MENVGLAFLLTLIAGLSTGIGSFIAFFAKKNDTRFLAVSLGFSAGVMIYISFVEILFEAEKLLSTSFGGKMGGIIAIAAFFGGMMLVALIDMLVPKEGNPHEVKAVDSESACVKLKKKTLFRTGLITAIGIAIHNFPEGIATFVLAMQSPSLAIPIVFAIAIHNIPEGIAVSVPIYYATCSKKKAFVYSFASGLSEPLGALIGYLILMPIMNDTVNGIINAAVAGIMVFISFDELLPAAREYGEHHLSLYGLVGGMLIMAISLWLFI